MSGCWRGCQSEPWSSFHGNGKEGFLEEVVLGQSLCEQEGTESDVGGRGSPEASVGTCLVCLKEDLWWPEGVGRRGGTDAQSCGCGGPATPRMLGFAPGGPWGPARVSSRGVFGAVSGKQSRDGVVEQAERRRLSGGSQSRPGDRGCPRGPAWRPRSRGVRTSGDRAPRVCQQGGCGQWGRGGAMAIPEEQGWVWLVLGTGGAG